MDTDAVVRELLDRQRVTDTIYRYASTIDRRDYDGLRRILADDLRAKYADRDWLEGGDVVQRWIVEHSDGFVFAHHFLSVYHIDFDASGNEAAALVYHTSNQVHNDDRTDVYRIVARYHLRLRRAGERWQISELIMEVGWSEHAKGVSRS